MWKVRRYKVRRYKVRRYKVDAEGWLTTECPIYPHVMIGSMACCNCKYHHMRKKNKLTVYCKAFDKHRNDAFCDKSCVDCKFFRIGYADGLHYCNKNGERLLEDDQKVCRDFREISH